MRWGPLKFCNEMLNFIVSSLVDFMSQGEFPVQVKILHLGSKYHIMNIQNPSTVGPIVPGRTASLCFAPYPAYQGSAGGKCLLLIDFLSFRSRKQKPLRKWGFSKIIVFDAKPIFASLMAFLSPEVSSPYHQAIKGQNCIITVQSSFIDTVRPISAHPPCSVASLPHRWSSGPQKILL